jgi:hypothetical protein
MHRRRAVESRERRLLLRQAIRCCKAALPEIIRSDARLRENFIHGNALASALRKPGFSFPKAAAIFFRHRFVVARGRGNGAGDGIDHHFQKMADCGKLAGIELVEQLVGVLFIHR